MITIFRLHFLQKGPIIYFFLSIITFTMFKDVKVGNHIEYMLQQLNNYYYLFSLVISIYFQLTKS